MTLILQTDKMQAKTGSGIGWITFNNPQRHNAISEEMWQAVPEILDSFHADPEVRAIVMRGAGNKAFVSGGDISEFEAKRTKNAEKDARKRYAETSAKAMTALERTELPLIAMIQGYCIGGGLLVAMTADLRIAAVDATFAIPAARLGLGYPFDQVKRLADLVGPAHAADILFTARRFGADEAKSLGLLNRVVAKAELENCVIELASTIAENAPLTVKSLKYSIKEYMRDPDKRNKEHCDDLVRACGKSEDFIEGARAFMEKRKPQFRGR